MIAFLIKKTFFDMWDNLYRFMFMNLLYIALVIGTVMIPFKIQSGTSMYLLLFTCIILLYIYTGGVSHVCKEIADYNRPRLKDFITGIKATYKTSFIFGFISIIYIYLLIIIFRIYGTTGGSVGLIIVGILFWINLLIFLSIMYFFPVQSRLDKRFLKIIKKSVYLFFDNTLLSIGLCISSLVIITVSSMTLLFLFFFGPASIMLLLNVALKLRMYKYDYLEQNSDANKHQIPWNTLLEEEKEKVGKRTFKNFLFPWRD